MSKNKKIRRIRLLMIFSQLLLTAFVVYWISERFEYEKLELRKELLRDFQFSEQKMLDTMIMDRMISPLLLGRNRDSSKIAFFNAKNNKSVVRFTKTTKPENKNKDSLTVKLNFNNELFDTIITRESNQSNQRNIVNIVKKNPTSEKILIEGVKVFMNIVNDSISDSISQVAVFSHGFDTSILKNQFNKRLMIHKFQPIWTTCSDSDSVKIGKAQIYFASDMLNGKVGVTIENYTLYVIRKLAPNILFGFLLLLITGTSFIISFINLKKQLQLNSMRNEFVGNITHELKTPVATVKVALEALSNFNIKDDPTQSAEYIKIASLELDRLDFLIQKVLNSTIHESNPNMMTLEPVDIDMTLREVLKTMQVRFINENATVEMNRSGHNFVVIADKIHLQGVIINLLDNSLKYTKGNPKIEVTLKSNDLNVELSISDDGIGIPEEFHSRIFDKFFRVPANNKHNVKGYGLGLNYVAMVVKQLNGNIKISNNSDAGCTFTLTFPKHKN